MNKAITDGINFMPPLFKDGLTVWSSGDGTPGSDTYDGAANAAFVPADADFSGCLELQKNINHTEIAAYGADAFAAGVLFAGQGAGSKRSVAICLRCGLQPGPAARGTPTFPA